MPSTVPPTEPHGALPSPVWWQRVRDAVLHAADAATVVIKAAAVADYRPRRLAGEKIASKQEGLRLELEPTPDIIRELGTRKGDRFLVGFAAETHDLREHAQAKLVGKGVDLIVANDVSRSDIGFDAAENEEVESHARCRPRAG